MTIKNFELYYQGKKLNEANSYKGKDQPTNFILFMKDRIEKETLSERIQKTEDVF